MLNEIEKGEIRQAMKSHAWKLLMRELGQKVAEKGNLYELMGEDKGAEVVARQIAREIVVEWVSDILGSLDEDISMVEDAPADDIFVRAADGE